jgi:hypothetical protein
VIVQARFREVEEQVESTAEASPDARLLALAYAIELAVEDGRLESVAAVARALGLSRARLSQVMSRRWLQASNQVRILCEK